MESGDASYSTQLDAYHEIGSPDFLSARLRALDVIAHALWAGAAGWVLRRRRGPRISGRMVGAVVGLAVAPDVVPMLPVVAEGFSEPAPLQYLLAHIAARPGSEPSMSPLLHALSHHLHCALHSVVIAAVVTAMVWRWRAAWLPVLLGWWLHIALDVPTHSDDYYPVPVFYPFTYWGVDGVAWNTPWMLAANYLALAVAYASLLLTRQRG